MRGSMACCTAVPCVQGMPTPCHTLGNCSTLTHGPLLVTRPAPCRLPNADVKHPSGQARQRQRMLRHRRPLCASKGEPHVAAIVATHAWAAMYRAGTCLHSKQELEGCAIAVPVAAQLSCRPVQHPWISWSCAAGYRPCTSAPPAVSEDVPLLWLEQFPIDCVLLCPRPQFEEIFSKYDKGNKGGLTLQELQVGCVCIRPIQLAASWGSHWEHAVQLCACPVMRPCGCFSSCCIHSPPCLPVVQQR